MTNLPTSSRPDGPELVAAALTLGYSAAVNRLLPEPAYIPANLLAAGALVGVAAASGCDAEDLGLGRGDAGRGMVAGAIVAAATGAAVVGVLGHTRMRRFFAEDRGEQWGGTAYQALVRIPVGTALAEEVVFRGALFGILARRRPRWQAALISSALFGVWHVLPTHDSLAGTRRAGGTRDRRGAHAATLAATVGVTTVAGLGLSWLRVRSRSVAAPVLAHAAVNMAAYLGSRLLTERAE